MPVGTERQIQRHFRYTDKGHEAIAAGLRLFFREHLENSCTLHWMWRSDGFFIHTGNAPSLSGPWAEVGAIDDAAEAAQKWLNGLSRSERYAIHRSTPMDSFRGATDDGFTMTDQTVDTIDVVCIIPAWV
ncbi:MAG TPA: hypothetical protein VMT23_00705 [Candidatus Binatia bacterium]|nr:hypothetical protein [Candidatus Binatia bacterium]